MLAAVGDAHFLNKLCTKELLPENSFALYLLLFFLLVLETAKELAFICFDVPSGLNPTGKNISKVNEAV